MLKDEVALYTELSGKDGSNTSIGVIGAYLDGYEKGKSERKKGRWSIKNGELTFWDVCSECGGMVIHKAPFYDFCPKCGADMR